MYYRSKFGKDVPAQMRANMYLQASVNTEASRFSNSTGIYTNDQSLTRQLSNKSIERSSDKSKDFYIASVASRQSNESNSKATRKDFNPSPIPIPLDQKSRNTSPLETSEAMKSDLSNSNYKSGHW